MVLDGKGRYPATKSKEDTHYDHRHRYQVR